MRIYRFIWFLLWPFLTFVSLFKNWDKKYTRFYIVAFGFIYGFSIFQGIGGDLGRFSSAYETILEYTWSDYIYLCKTVFSSSRENDIGENVFAGKPDLYALTLGFTISRLTSNIQWFWGAVSAIYYSLLWGFLVAFTKKYSPSNSKDKFYITSCFIMAFFVIPFHFPVIGVRFWPALIILLWSGMSFLEKSNVKNFVFLSSSIFFHYSFLPFLVLIPLFKLIIFNRIIQKSVLLTSVAVFLFVPYSNIIELVGSFLPSSSYFSDEIAGYLSLDVADGNKEKTLNLNWYVTSSRNIFLSTIIIFVFLDTFGTFQHHVTESSEKLRSFSLLLLTYSLFTYHFGGARFIYGAYLLSIFRILELVSQKGFQYRINYFFRFFAGAYVFYILIVFRASFYSVDPVLLFGNFFCVLFFESGTNLSLLLIGH